MKILFLLTLLIFPIFAFCIGFVLVIRPGSVIEMQRRFYERINWKIEPISMQKELRNTKIMGLFLVIISLLTIVCALIRLIYEGYS